MDRIERICANCGTANPVTNARCSHCGTNLVSLPARRDETRMTMRANPGAMAVALGAGALIARAGFEIVSRVLAPAAWRLAKRALKPKSSPPVESQAVADDPDADMVIHGWRVWSVRRGSEHSSGSEKFEWKIKSK